jgi:hypothetical protein
MATGGESQAQNVRDLIVAAVVAAVFSSFTLWLIDSWIKYPLFLFETVTIIVLYSILNNHTAKLAMKHIRTWSVNGGLVIDTCFMVSASSLLVINAVGIQAGLLQLVLTFLCTSLLSGYALLNILGVSESFSKLESLVISYVVSFASSSILFLILLPLNLLIRPIIMCVFFFSLGIFSLIKHLKKPTRTLRTSFSKPIDALALVMTVLFYLFAFFLMYPNYALLPGTDISGVFARSVVLNRTPDLYAQPYFFFNLFEACLYSLSTPSVAAFQSSLQILNWISPLVFYVMAKEHLESIDRRLPSIATVCWVLFSNLGWLYFVKLKLTSNVQSQLQLISITADKTIFGPILASFGLEYTPIVVSFIMLLVLIYLLKRLDLPTKKYVPLFSIITATMHLTHPIEVTVFALFLALYSIFSRSESLRVNDSLKASLLGFLVAGAVYYIVLPTLNVRFASSIQILLSIITPILSLSFALCLRRLSTHIPKLKIKQRFKIPWAKAAIIGLLFLYAVAFLTWASSADTFNMSPSGSVPPHFYPLMLGVTGLLSLLALIQITRVKGLSKLVFFVGFIFFAFVAGRTISFLNANLFDSGYWEYRFLTFAVIGTSILAPITIVRFALNWRGKAPNRTALKTLGICLIISVITLAGVSSSFLGLEYWHTFSSEPALIPSNQEFDALNHMKTVFDADPYSWLLTVTSGSYDTNQFSAPAYQMSGGRPVLYTAENPEVPLYMLYYSDLSHPYLYMDSRDEAFLQQNYQDGYLAQHLIPMLPAVFQNQEVTVYNMSAVVPPTTNSENALVVPFDESAVNGKPYLYAYGVLSQGLYDYTVSYDMDDKLTQQNTLVLSYDPPRQNTVASSFNEDFSHPENGWTQDSGDWSSEQGKLLGGQQGQYTSGNILSPVSPENFTATFKVTPLGGQRNTPGFARLLYSWRDAENYRSADLVFGNDGLIYVYFFDESNGEFTEYPAWPGIDSGVKWVYNMEQEIKVNVDGDSCSIYVDNTLFYTAHMKNVKGNVGLGYEGFYSVAFSQFQVEGTGNVALRNFNDYTDYVRSGGRLIVLNTNGYGRFADSLLSPSNTTFDAGAIKASNQTLELPANVEATVLNLESDDAEILSNYTSTQGESTVYAVRKPLGNGQLFYVNLYPLINHLESEGDQSSLYNLLGKLLAVAGLDLDKCQLDALPTSVSTFENALLNGEVRVESNSVLFPLQVNIKTVNVTANGEHSTFNNVTSLSLKNYEKTTIQTRSVSISEGKGLYTALTLNDTTQLTQAGNDTVLSVTANDEEFKLDNATNVLLDLEEPLEIYARTPSIDSSGNASLTQTTIPGSLNGRQIFGQGLEITGTLTFDTYLSDSYTLAENIRIDGSFITSPSLITYDEWAVLPTIAFWALILFPIFIGSIIIFYYLKRADAKQKILSNVSNT